MARKFSGGITETSFLPELLDVLGFGARIRQNGHLFINFCRRLLPKLLLLLLADARISRVRQLRSRLNYVGKAGDR